jgi:superfamily II DNA helicase RecQ
MPQFFVLSASTLRSIVLSQPRTLDHLQTIPGLGQEKLEQFGSSILAICNA